MTDEEYKMLNAMNDKLDLIINFIGYMMISNSDVDMPIKMESLNQLTNRINEFNRKHKVSNE